MAGVYHDHLIACPFCKSGGFTVGLYNISDLLLGKPLYRSAVRPDVVAGTPLADALLLAPVGEIGACILTGMGKLDARYGTVTADRVSHKGVGCQVARGGQVQMEHMAAVGFRMHHQLTDGNSSGATSGAKLIKALRSGAGGAIGGDVCCTHGGGEHTVSEGNVAQSDGAGKMRIWIGRHIWNSFQLLVFCSDFDDWFDS